MPVHIMIDIEDLGEPILSIGAVRFYPSLVPGEPVEKFYVNIDLFSSLLAGFEIKPETLDWWRKQSKEAQNSFLSPAPKPVLDALTEFADWIKTFGPDVRIWAKPPSYDIVKLEYAFAMLGMSAPWDFRAPRDLRTLIELSGIDVDNKGTKHNALDDAIAQSECVQAGYRRLFVTSSD